MHDVPASPRLCKVNDVGLSNFVRELLSVEVDQLEKGSSYKRTSSRPAHALTEKQKAGLDAYKEDTDRMMVAKAKSQGELDELRALMETKTTEERVDAR